MDFWPVFFTHDLANSRYIDSNGCVSTVMFVFVWRGTGPSYFCEFVSACYFQRGFFLPWIKVLIRRTSCDIIDWTGNIVSPLIVVFWMRLVVQPISSCFFVEMILFIHSMRYTCNAWSPTTNERKTESNGINDNKWILEWMHMKWTYLLKGSSPSSFLCICLHFSRIDQDLLGLTFPANMCSTYATQLALLALSLWRVWTWSLKVPGSCVCLKTV